MLNPFPVQFLAMFAYFLLRFAIGSIMLYLGFSHFRHRHELRDALTLSWFPFGTFSTWTLILAELLLGSLLIIGAHTQYVALCIMAMCFEMIILRNYFNHPKIPRKIFYILLFAASTSLFITGAGALAFDLPI